MREAKIFLLAEDEGSLTPMVETAYAKEDVLQALLARYPDLLPGDQIDPDNPRRWLLVMREMPVPAGEGGVDRWSLDHLFVDQDATPTFVECKRAADTRSRREVVSQMLDYAANGVEYWPGDRLRQAAAETAARKGKSIDDEVRTLTGAADDADVEAFWQAVEGNLRAGKVRLVFVADQVPKELRRLVEFLNEKMNDVEVLAVEVKQFLGGQRKTLVPRVVGLTEKARVAKGSAGPAKRRTTPADFLAKCTPATARFFQRVLELAGQRGHSVSWGTTGFTVRARQPPGDRLATFAYCSPPAGLELYTGSLPLSDEEAAALRQRLLALGVFRRWGDKAVKSNLSNETDLPKLSQAFDLVLEAVDKPTRSDEPPRPAQPEAGAQL